MMYERDSGQRVLIVDDDAHLRKTLHDILNLKGYHPLRAANGAEALDISAAEKPAVALVDLRLEDMPGLEVVQGIRQRSPMTECIVLTGHATQESAIDAVNLGAYAYVEKPYAVDMLLITIRRAIEKRETTLALRQSEERFRLAVNNSNSGIGLATLDGRFILVNPAMCDMVGYTEAELLERTYLDITHPDDVETSAARFRRAAAGELDGYELEKRYVHKDGRTVWVVLNLSVVRDSQGQPSHVVGQLIDVTERKRAEEEIRFQAQLLDTVEQAVMAADPDSRFIYWNRFAEKLFGWTAEEAMGKSGPELFLLDMPMAQSEAIRARLTQGESWTGELMARDKSGRVFPTMITATPILNEAGKMIGFVGVSYDLTERKRQEQAIRETAERMQAQFQSVPVPTLLWRKTGQDFVLVGYNRAVEAETDGKAINILGVKAGDILANRPDIFADLEECFSTGRILRREFRYHLTTTDAESDFAVTYAFVPPDTVMLHGENITERKATQRALERSEARFRAAIEGGPDAFAVCNAVRGETGQIVDFEVVEVSERGARMVAMARDDLLGMHLGVVLPGKWYDQVLPKAAEVIETGRPFTTEVPGAGIYAPAGWYCVEVVPLGDGIAMTVQNITQRKQAEDALQASETRLRTILRTAPIGIGVVVRRVIQDVNEFVCQMTGYAREELIGQSARMLYPSQEEFERVGIVKYAEIEGTGQGTVETQWVRKDGITIDVLLSSSFSTPGDPDAGVTFAALDITARKLAQEAERDQRQLAETLAETAAALNRTLDLEAVMQTILENVERVVPHDAANIIQIMEDGSAACVIACRGYEERGVSREAMLGVEFSLKDTPNLAQMAADQRPYIIHDTRASDEWLTVPSAVWVRSYVGAPLVVEGTTIGYISLDSAMPGFFTPTHAKRLQAVGQYAGAAISNARLFGESQKRARYLAALNTASHRVSRWGLDLDGVLAAIVNSLVDTVGAALARIWLADENGQELALRASASSARLEYDGPNLVQVADDPTTIGLIARDKKPLLTNQVLDDNRFDRAWAETNGMTSFAGYPLMREDSLIAVLAVFSREPIDGSLIDMLGSFVNQAAIAIENARLYRELEAYSAFLEQAVADRTLDLLRSTERVKAIVDSSSDVISITSRDGTIHQANPAFTHLFGLPVDQVVGKNLTTLVVEEHGPILAATLDAVVTGGQPKRIEVIACRPDERVFDADIALSPIMQPDEQVADIICSLRDISERKQLEKQLRRMLDREMEISEMRSRFISMAAHDLRNPLAVIKTSAGLLAKYRNQLSDEQQHEKYDRIQSSINVMIDLLDDILTIGRVEAGKLSFQPEEFDLREFCEALVSEVSAVTGASQEIVFVAPEKCSAVVMDRKLIRHIISNLLSNAVKYSPDDSPIRFGLSCDGNYVVFRVEDQGIGIPLADQQRLFEAFHRARNVGQVAGTGLGLTIVKQSAELHGGTIQFTSAENVGTTFTVRIPYVIARGQTE